MAQQLMHKLLGSCGDAGADNMYKCCQQLDELLKQQNTEQALFLMQTMLKSFNTLKAFLENNVNNL